MTPQLENGLAHSPPAFTPEEVVGTSVPSRPDQPAWDVARLFPVQGEWTEADYLSLDTNRIVELCDGSLEVHPLASLLHQFIVDFLLDLLKEYLRGKNLGTALMAPSPLRIGPKTFREPDIFVFRPEQIETLRKPLKGADVVIEVVSEGAENRERDLVTKRAEYAEAGIKEYWIVDPETQSIVVLRLHDAGYAVHGEFKSGERATSITCRSSPWMSRRSSPRDRIK